jgi:hypothetical protein
MKRIILFCFVFVILINSISASNVGLIENSTWQWNLTGSSSANGAVLGDIDNDGDLDMISIGCDSSCTTGDPSYVWINNGTTLIENSTWQQNLSKAGTGSLALGDINNDGYLDLVISGSKAPFTQIYINNGTTFNSNSTWQNLLAGSDGAASYSVAIGDIDNDGDLDLIFPGMELNRVFWINNGTTFTNSSVWGQEIIDDTSKISTGLIDLDNDGDLDLNIIGMDSARSYINNGTSFFYNVSWNTDIRDEGNVAWGDVDNDGNFEVVTSGPGGASLSFFFYNGDYFAENSSWNSDLSNLGWGSMMLGDYDNNGYLDLVNLGSTVSPQLQVAENNGITFARDYTAEENFTGSWKASALFGDIDDDGDLDLMVIDSQKVYISNASLTNPNEAPIPPTNFSYSYNNREVSIGWNNGTDNETSTMGLYYNLKLGTASNNHSIISGVYGGAGDASRGGTAFGYFGNMMQRKNFTLKVDRLQPSTTYYWSVQTIDTGLQAGNWSTVQSFTTQADLERPDITLNSPISNANLSSSVITFNVTVTDKNVSSVSLWGNWTGTWQINETNSSGINGTYIFTKDLLAFGDGTYKWMIQAEDNATNKENSTIRTFMIDATAPNIASEVKTPSIVYTNNNSILNATITDALMGVDSVWISVNATGTFVNYSVSSAGSVYSFVLGSGNYSKDTNVTWRYYANDSLGNEQIGTLQSFIITNSPPVLIGIPDNSTDEDVTPPNKFYNLSLYASDADLDNLTFYIQNQSNSSLINCFISESFHINCSTPAGNQSGYSTIVVNVTDGSDWANYTFNITVNPVNDIPWLSNVNLTAENLNRTNETLTGGYTFNDVESASETSHEIKWYRNNSEVTGLANLSSISSENTTKDENWTFSVRVNDGTNWSSWYNSSDLTIQNSPPDFSTISNQSWVMNSNLTINLNLYFSDLDLDSLTYSNSVVENISVNINQTTGIVVLTPDANWNGTGYVIFNGSDSEVNSTSNNITLSVFKPIINFTGFDGDTTNFSDMTSFVNASIIIEKSDSGKINFDSVTLNNTQINISEYINISFNRIELNSTALPELNKSATLYLYNLTTSNPQPLKDGVFCSDCSEVSYTGGIFAFNVTSFSVYSSEETPTCLDGIQNQGETGVDCGGPCDACSTGSSGGGGGSRGSLIKTYTITDTQIREGYTNILAKGDRMNFSLDSENHSLEIKSILGTLVNITLNSNPINFLISVNETKKFDFNSDSIYDLMVKLNSIDNNKINLTIQEINEEIVEDVIVDKIIDEEEVVEGEDFIETTDDIKKDLTKYWIIAGIILIIAGLGIRWYFWKRKK